MDGSDLEPDDGLQQGLARLQAFYAERMAERLQAMGQPNYRNGFKRGERLAEVNARVEWAPNIWMAERAS
jgi:protein gp37